MRERFDPFPVLNRVPAVLAVLVLAFLAAPLVVVVPMAFNASSLLSFPPKSYSLRWFQAYFESSSWTDATWNSVFVGSSVAAISTLLGLGLAIAFERLKFPGRDLIRALIMAPLFMPVIVLSVGLYVLYLELGLNGSFLGIIIGHVVVTLPYCVVVIGNALKDVDPRLEQAAVGLGARPATAFSYVTLPLIAPGLIVAALFGFLISFDEVVIAIFVTGPQSTTLPRRIWDGIRFDLDPTIAAVATLLIALSAAVLVLGEVLRHWLGVRQGANDRA